MTAQVNRLLYCGTDKGIGSGSDIVEAIGAAFAAGIRGELVHVAAGLESEVPERLEAGFLAENGKIEFAAKAEDKTNNP